MIIIMIIPNTKNISKLRLGKSRRGYRAAALAVASARRHARATGRTFPNT
jgi:hypothetical protein